MAQLEASKGTEMVQVKGCKSKGASRRELKWYKESKATLIAQVEEGKSKFTWRKLKSQREVKWQKSNGASQRELKERKGRKKIEEN